MTEHVDVVDEENNVIDTVTRAEAYEKRLRHRTTHVILFNDEKVLGQLRTDDLRIRPGHWTSSAAGAVQSGENPKRSAKREMQEEIGVDTTLDFVDTYQRDGEYISEIVYVYVGTYNGEFDLQADEVDTVRWFTPEEIPELDKVDPNFTQALHVARNNSHA